MAYVYEHTRPDTGAIFYVGKGKGSRSNTRSGRNNYWNNIVRKAGSFKVRRLVENIDEELAFLIECERISQLKEQGVVLCNMTDGGEGTSGYTHTSEARTAITANSRAVVAELKATGVKHWMLGTKLSPETKSKIGESGRGYKHTDEAKQKMSEAGKLRRHSEETLSKMSKAGQAIQARLKQEGTPHWNKGVKRSDETKAKLRAITTGKKWFNNGTVQKLCLPEDAPINFTIGRIKKCI